MEWDGGEGRKEEKGEGGMEGKEASHPGTSFSFFLPSPSSLLLRVCVSVSHRRPLPSFQLEGRRREETVFVGGVLSSW